MKQFNKEERSWIMYDWANSAFATIMLAAVFPVFFVNMAGGEGTYGSMWWARGISLSRVILGIFAPVIGALIAYKGIKKRLFVSFIALGILFHVLLVFQDNWMWLLVGYIFAYMFWSAGNIIYDSYLPDVTAKDRMDKVSAWGYAMGYIGGSTIPFIFSIFLILFGESDWFPFVVDNITAVRISILITAVWWAVFSIPMIKNVRHKYEVEAPQYGLMKQAFGNVWITAKKIMKNKGLFLFIIAYFFYIDGVGTIIGMATAYGAELGLGAEGMIGALFVTQIVAIPCSILFGKLADRVNSINIIATAVCIYLAICITAFIMGFGLEEYWFGEDVATIMFWVLALMVGTVQGGIQATSRAVYGRLVPPEESGEYFGFFEIFGRFAAIIGPFLYAMVFSITGRPSFSMFSVIIIFIIGLTILLFSKKHLDLRPVKEV